MALQDGAGPSARGAGRGVGEGTTSDAQGRHVGCGSFLIGWEGVGETARRELVVYILRGLGVEEATSVSKWVGGDG